MLQIRVTRLGEVSKFVGGLKPSIQKVVRKEGGFKLSENLKGRIRRRYTLAGYGKGMSSGIGFKSIIAEPTRFGGKVEILAPWLALIEGGVKSHYVSRYTMQKHMESPGSTMFQRAPKGEYGGAPYWWTYKGPFVAPAMTSFRPEIPRLLSQYIKQAIMEAK